MLSSLSILKPAIKVICLAQFKSIHNITGSYIFFNVVITASVSLFLLLFQDLRLEELPTPSMFRVLPRRRASRFIRGVKLYLSYISLVSGWSREKFVRRIVLPLWQDFQILFLQDFGLNTARRSNIVFESPK